MQTQEVLNTVTTLNAVLSTLISVKQSGIDCDTEIHAVLVKIIFLTTKF